MGFLFGLWRKNIVKLMVITVLVLLFFRYAIPALAPFWIALVFVLAFRPFIKKIREKIKVPEGIITGFLLGIFALVLMLAGWYLLCCIMDLVGEFRQQEDVFRSCCMEALQKCCDYIGNHIHIRPEHLEKNVLRYTNTLVTDVKENFAPKALDASYSYAGTIFEGGFCLVVTVIAIILLMKDYEQICRKLADNNIFKTIKKMGYKILELLKIYIKAQGIIVLCVSAVSMAGLLACDVSKWYFWGFLTGILDMLPFVGSGIVLVPFAVVALIQGKIWKGVGCLFIYGICVFLRQILEPKLIGNKINMYPILILISVFFGVRFFSIGGIVLGPVSLFLIREIYEELKE